MITLTLSSGTKGDQRNPNTFLKETFGKKMVK